MKKLQFIPMVAAIVGIMLALTTTAFTKETKKVVRQSETVFQFSPSAQPTEANFESAANWTVLASVPGSNPCTAGTNAPCVVHIDNSLPNIQSGDNAATRKSKFAAYLVSISDLDGGSSGFVNSSSNYDYRRQ